MKEKKISKITSKIAVLMSIYAKTKLKELIKAINSIEIQEEVFCDLLLNIDGDIDKNIDNFLNNYEPKGSIKNLKILKSQKNLGLAASLNNLLLNYFIFYEFFFRHDSDDYSSKKRFSYQLNFLKQNPDIDIVGTAFKSFDLEDDKLMVESYFPCNHDSISKAFAYSTPLAHATACFRKSFFIKAGIYQPNHNTLTEDNRLWYSAFYTGCRFANINKVLYFVGIEKNSYKRRSRIKQTIILFKIRCRFVIYKRLGFFYLLKAILEFILRLSISILIFIKLDFIANFIVNLYQTLRSRIK